METEYSIKTRLLAGSGMVLMTVIWGGAFVAMKTSVDMIPPAWLLTARFLLSAAAMIILFHRNLIGINRKTVFHGCITGFFFGAAYLFQTYGLKYTTASKNAFITTLYVIMVPFIFWAVKRKKPGNWSIAAAFIAVAGLGLLTLEGDLSVGYGDFLTLLCGIGFAFQITFVGIYTQEGDDPLAIGVIQIIVGAAMCLILAPFLDGPVSLSLLADSGVIASLLYVSLLSTALCTVLQNIGQKYISAGTASILMSLEAVFGAIFSALILKEVMTARMITGCVLIFSALILSEAGPVIFEKVKNG